MQANGNIHEEPKKEGSVGMDIDSGQKPGGQNGFREKAAYRKLNIGWGLQGQRQAQGPGH